MENQNNIQEQELLIHKIGKCLTASLKPTDYFVGYAPYNFNFVVEEYKGETLFSEKITPLEQAIVGILSIDQGASIEKIGSILGFNVLQDAAENSILSDSIKLLCRHHVLEGDDSLYCLTNDGRVFAAKGKRPEKATYNFKIWYNKAYPEITFLKDSLNANNIIEVGQIDISKVQIDLDVIKSIATKQTPKVHNPQDERILVGAELLKSTSYTYMLYACFIRNVLTGDVRTLIYDESQEEISIDFSNFVNQNESLKAELFDSIVESVFIPEEAQVKEIEKVEDVSDGEIEIEYTDNNGTQKLHKKALYDEITFENELSQIFTDDKPDEVWLISPWIGYFFVQCRVPMIEQVLKEGTKVFIAYSKKDPRDKNRTDMVNPLAKKEIDRLTNTYPSFFCVELPKIFHTKNVLEIKGNQAIMFSGSFNILSFAIQESHKIIRGEQMAFVNPQKAKTEYKAYIDTFADIYINLLKEKLLHEEKLTINDLKDDRIRYFSTKSNRSAEINDILDEIDEKIVDFQKEEWSIKVHKLNKMISPLLARGIITLQDRNYFRKEISTLKESAKMLDLDDELVNMLDTLQGHFEKLKVRKLAEKVLDEHGNSISETTEVEENYSNDIECLYQKNGSGKISPENISKARNIIRKKKINNTHQVIRYIVSLNLMRQAIKNKSDKSISFFELNSCILNLIEKSENKFPNLSIFIQGDITFLDIAGIQVSFYKVPHTDKTKSIISSRVNMVNENKSQKLHLYADELFNVVIKKE